MVPRIFVFDGDLVDVLQPLAAEHRTGDGPVVVVSGRPPTSIAAGSLPVSHTLSGDPDAPGLVASASLLVLTGPDEPLAPDLHRQGPLRDALHDWAVGGRTLWLVGPAAAAAFACTTRRGPAGVETVNGAGLVPMSLCLHHDDRDVADAYYGWIWKQDVPAGIAVDSAAGALLVDGAVADVVATRPGAHVYETSHVAGEVICRGRWSRLIGGGEIRE